MIVAKLAIGYLWMTLGLLVAGLILALRDAVRDLREQMKSEQPRFSDAESSISRLLRSGYNGGTLVLVDEISRRRIEFSKRIRAKGDYGICLTVPADATWAGAKFADVRVICRELGLTDRIEQPAGQESERQFSVNFGRDSEAAYALALAIWTRLFNRSIDEPCGMKEIDCSFAGNLIDSPDIRPPWSGRSATPADYYEQRFADVERQTGLSIFEHLLTGILALAFVASLFALPVTTILAHGGTPDWSAEIGGLTLQGGNASLAWLATGCLSLMGPLYVRWKLKQRSAALGHSEQRLRLGYHVVFPTVVLAVLILWVGQ